MGQRSRKRGRREKLPAAASAPPRGTGPATGRSGPAVGRSGPASDSPGPAVGRSERRNAEVRARLTPLAQGERPGAVTVGAGLAALAGVGNLVAYVAGAKIAGKHPAAGGIIIFTVLMVSCAIGMWRMWYGAVLAFMALLAIIMTIFALLLTEASNLLGFLVPPVLIAGAGFLFWKLVRALSRIQMPRYPGR